MTTRPLQRWLAFMIAILAVMVVLGGVTRLTGSGLSITEWKPITGAVPPLSEAAWEMEFAKYREIPQFREVNAWMQLADFKRIFFWEYLHRLFGRLIGVAFLVPFLFFASRRQIPRRWLGPLIFLFALGGLQGFIGWFMVKSGLSQLTSVSHLRLALHLLTAFFIGAAMLWVRIAMQDEEDPRREAYRLRLPTLAKLSHALAALVVFQSFYGALTAGLKAGFQFPTFPTFNGQWIPDRIVELTPLALNWVSNPITVQWVHRLTGTLLLLGSMGAWLWWRSRLEPHLSQRRALAALTATVALQYAVGIGVVLLGVPVWIGTLHQAIGFALILKITRVCYEMRA